MVENLTDSTLALDADACISLSGALLENDGRPQDVVRTWAREAGYDDARTKALMGLVQRVLARINLRRYATEAYIR